MRNLPMFLHRVADSILRQGLPLPAWNLKAWIYVIYLKLVF